MTRNKRTAWRMWECGKPWSCFSSKQWWWISWYWNAFFLSNRFLCVVLMPGSFAHLQILWQCVDFHTGECSIQNWQWDSKCGSCEDCCLWCQNYCPLSFDAWKCYLNWHRVDTLSIVHNDVRELEQAQLAQYARCIVFTQNKLLQNTSAWWHWFESSGSCR